MAQTPKPTRLTPEEAQIAAARRDTSLPLLALQAISHFSAFVGRSYTSSSNFNRQTEPGGTVTWYGEDENIELIWVEWGAGPEGTVSVSIHPTTGAEWTICYAVIGFCGMHGIPCTDTTDDD